MLRPWMPLYASLSGDVFYLGSRRTCWTASARSPVTIAAGPIADGRRFVGTEGTVMLRIAVKLWVSRVCLARI